MSELVTQNNPGWQETVGLWNRVLAELPDALFQWAELLGFVAAGYLVARLLERFAIMLCEWPGLNQAVGHPRLLAAMQRFGITSEASSIVGRVVFCVTTCSLLSLSIDLAGRSPVSSPIDEHFVYFPKRLVPAVMLLIGLVVSSFLRSKMAWCKVRGEISYAEHAADVMFVMLLCLALASELLDFDFRILKELIVLVGGGIMVGCALALAVSVRRALARVLGGSFFNRRRATTPPS